MSSSKKFWDKSANKYAASEISDVSSYERKLVETQQLLSPEMNVVEFGCGTGTTAICHAPFVNHIYAIDISENMIQIGRAKASEAGVANITFTRGSLLEFTAPESSIDVVLGLNILHLVADRRETLKEVGRILKPGGIFVSSTACIGNSAMRLIKFFTPVGKLLGLMPDVYVFTDAELKEEMLESGFNIERQWCHGNSVETWFVVSRKV